MTHNIGNHSGSPCTARENLRHTALRHRGKTFCEICGLDLVTHIVSPHSVVLSLPFSPAAFDSPPRAKLRSLGQFTGHRIRILFGADLHVFCLAAFHFEFIGFEPMWAIRGKCNYNRAAAGCFPSDKKSRLQPGLGTDITWAGGLSATSWWTLTGCFPPSSMETGSSFPGLMDFAKSFHQSRLHLQCFKNVFTESVWQSKIEYTCTVFIIDRHTIFIYLTISLVYLTSSLVYLTSSLKNTSALWV